MKRTKTSKAWMREHVTDAYVKRARAEGVRSRAAYKLEEIAGRDGLLERGSVVVDLGAAPGSWSAFAARAVGPAGLVIALDLLEMAPVPGVRFVQGDFRERSVEEALVALLGGRAVDLVMSDMAPNISGIPLVDQSRAMELCELALEFSRKYLKPNGNFLVKVFHGSGFEGFVKDMRAAFTSVVVRKPDASRDRSREVYLLGRGLRQVAQAVDR